MTLIVLQGSLQNTQLASSIILSTHTAPGRVPPPQHQGQCTPHTSIDVRGGDPLNTSTSVSGRGHLCSSLLAKLLPITRAELFLHIPITTVNKGSRLQG
mmetsp:Transcript_10301/g.28088  ORF Transcript_10301/g.28088 Transcript_10301/m.28088 type:complete len:99 (+) Transcript_10301:2723-3019(+)|eukprot:1150166-Pelagomonas_calceolata.AAC.2